MDANDLAFFLTLFLIGILFGAAGGWAYFRLRMGGFQRLSNEVLAAANKEAEALRKNAEISLKQAQFDQQREMEHLWQQERKKILKEEERVKQREDKLEARIHSLEKKQVELEKREIIATAHFSKIEEEKKSLELQRQQLVEQLEKTAGLSANEARELLMARITNEVKTDTAHMVRKLTKEAEEEADDIAKKIIVTAINRLAVPTVSEATVTTVNIPSEEMKGRIIGKEGRNIRTLERATGVNFVIDDTLSAVVVCGFDPVRIHVAKQALAELVADGRIHPTRIEEVVEKVHQDMQKKLRHYGEDAALRAGAVNLHPELILLLGKLKLRYSFGQNILDHSLEVSHLMGLMADELGLDSKLARRIGLLHDMGKAVSHEIEGPHAIVGHKLALKYGESVDVATGIGCHHFEMPSTTIEGNLCIAADAISASRPGARIEAVEEYVKRLKKLEQLAMSYQGVERAFALQAGREVLVIVQPEAIDDDGIAVLARDLSKQVENELTYPGRIKVTVVRERKAVEYAM